MDNDGYKLGASITGFLVFVGSYIYCIATYGFLFGLGLGWLPSLIVATFAAFLWPLVWLAIAGLIFLILRA